MRLAQFKYRPILHATDTKHQTNKSSAYLDHHGFDSQAKGAGGSTYFSHDVRGDKTHLDARIKLDMTQSVKKPLMSNHPNPAILNMQQAPTVYKPILASSSQSMHLSTALKGQAGHRFNSPARQIGQQIWNKPANRDSDRHLLQTNADLSAAASFAGQKPSPEQKIRPADSNPLDRNLSNTPAKVQTDGKMDGLSYLSPASPKDPADTFSKKTQPANESAEMTADQREEYQQLLSLKTDLLSMITTRRSEKDNITRVNQMLLKKIELISQNSHQRLRTM